MITDAVHAPANCPRCGRAVTGAQFSGSGLCPACAATSLLNHTQGDRASLSPFPDLAGSLEHIGPYQIIETLGTGGMGTVYLAQHRQLGRIVALKVIPLHGNGGRGLRFQREAQTVASLRHPHIVTVHDAGQDRQHFYFAMDYIEGGDLAQRLRARPFQPRGAAELMQKIAIAVAHSHAQGVLHRDLKPSNILLEGDEPRVADFGLATPLEAGGDLTPHTSVLGTPHYLAPEALLKGSSAQSPASDVYSLGIILYELLCARLPFTAATPVELQQLIAAGEPLAPHLLAPHIPRDLETICLKALAAEPARRYPTAAEFAEDLRRFLAGETILARPATPAERLWRWARRRPTLAALWLLLFVLAAGSTAAAWRINRERRAAEAEAAKSRALADFLQNDLLAQASPDQTPDRELKVRTLLDRAAVRIDGHFHGDALTEASIRATLGSTYLALGENASAEKQLRRAFTVRTAQLGASHLDTLSAGLDLGSVLNRQGRNQEAAALIDALLATATATYGERHPFIAHALSPRIDVLVAQGKLEEAEQVARRARSLARDHLPPGHAENRIALNNLAAVLWAREKLAEAEPLNIEALALYETTLGPEHPETLAVKNNLATVYGSHGRYADAERLNREVLALRQRVLGPDHPETLRSLSNLAFALANNGQAPAAITVYRELVAARQRVLGPNHTDTFTAILSLSATLGNDGSMPEAVGLLTELTPRAEQVLGPRHPLTLAAKGAYVRALVSSQRVAEALPIAEQVHAESLRQFGAEDARTLYATENVADLQRQLGQPAKSVEILRAVLAIRERTHPTFWRTAFTRGQLGRSLAAAGQAAEAEPLLRASYRVLSAPDGGLPSPQARILPAMAGELATICQATGRDAEAADWQAKASPPGK